MWLLPKGLSTPNRNYVALFANLSAVAERNV